MEEVVTANESKPCVADLTEMLQKKQIELGKVTTELKTWKKKA